MFKKCQSDCPADKNLWMRNKVFYFMVELPSQNGKRRYICKSLRTTNYYEAQQRLKIMVNSINSSTIQTKTLIYTAQSLINKMVFDEFEEEIEVGGQVQVRKVQHLSPNNDPKIINEFFKVVSKLVEIKNQTLDSDDIKIIQQIINKAVESRMGEFVKTMNVSVGALGPKSNHTIGYIVDSMLAKAEITKVVAQKKYKIIKNLIEGVGLKLTDEYSKFYKDNIIRAISDNIKAMAVTGSVKRTYAREIKNLITHANMLDPDTYKMNLINLVPNFKKTSNKEARPHWKFSDDALKQIFDTRNSYFKENPDVFWTTLIAMFVGARCNAAITLQYGDIVNEDGIDCIKFQNNHPIKQLKNDATIRTVPIPVQLLNLGFVDYVNRQRVKLKAKPSDFIFPKCQTKSGQYNNKFTTRGFIKYIKDIGITDKKDHKFDFHSLRKNANSRLENAGVIGTYINDIIGWEGKETREKHYTIHTLKDIKVEADKLKYEFLQEAFDKWREIMLESDK